MTRLLRACTKLALAGLAALPASTATARSTDADAQKAAPGTPMAQCLGQVADRTTAKNAPLTKPARLTECFQPSEIGKTGDVMLRLSSRPALGGVGYQVSIRPYDDQVAAVLVVIVDGHPGTGWIELLSAYSDISREQFDRLRKSFEAALSAPPVSQRSVNSEGKDVIIVCTDGPGYLAEIVEPSGTRQLEGFCGDHPNRRLAEEIGRIRSAVVSEFLGKSLR